jgi:hypothetical protein
MALESLCKSAHGALKARSNTSPGRSPGIASVNRNQGLKARSIDF